ncbi:S-layer homology domain-containing protein [Bacillus sp. FJAT-42315]|uniref:S-layer homology domain-containing protein n=1 Tax=Bacillus sp. FJAT-42315 TaxID=2014077 RepID=UPI000C24AE0D|nr:S-layer homology domain-containing protein [Bacillus sp. FJAT-42315]
MKRFLLICVVAWLVVGFMFPYSSQAATTAFKDVSSFKKEIEFLTGQGVIFGYSDGTFRPNEPILRVQAVQMLMREMKPELDQVPDPNFIDMKPGDRGYEDVAKAVALGVISGKGDNRFDPRGKLTRAEMAIILVRAYELGGIFPKGFSDVSKSSVAYWHISALAANNITVGYNDGTFRPGKTIDRAQFSAFMARIIEPAFQPENAEVADTYLEALFDLYALDYEMHPTEPVVYLLDGSSNEVVALNYDTYEIESVELTLPAERIAYANNKLYVTQLKGKHSPHWFDEDQQGAFAVIDTTTMTQEKLIDIDLDPYDIEADENGIVYISPGSGQHSSFASYDSATGKQLSSQMMYNKALIEMHPTQQRIYEITTALSPRTMSTYSITAGVLGEEQRSPYHGDYDLNKDLTISPDGKYLFNSTGHIFRSSATASADMTYFATLDQPYQSIAFDVANSELYTANGDKLITAYDYSTMEAFGQLQTYGNVKKMFYDEKDNTLLIFSTVKMGTSSAPVTGIEKVYFDVESTEE